MIYRKCVCFRLPAALFRERLEIPPDAELIGLVRRNKGECIDVYLGGDALPERFALDGREGPACIEVACVSELAESLAE